MTKRKRYVRTQRMPANECPRCHTVLDMATGIAECREDTRPTPGCVTLCAGCRTWLAYTDTLGLRLATAEEIEEVDAAFRRMAERAVIGTDMRRPRH